MALGTALALSVATNGVKKVIDDMYLAIKDAGINKLGSMRSDLKDQSIARALLSLTKVKTLWNIEKEVSLYEFYYSSTVEFSEGNKKRVTKIRDFGDVGHFVIQGTAGQGKSIFLRFLCGQELRPEQSSGRIPIFVELRRIRLDQSIEQLILQSLSKYKLPATETSWKYLAESGKFVLLLDAFDEIDPLLMDRTISELELIVEKFRETLQIIITSRPDADIQKSSLFRVFKLAQLTPTDHAPFLKKICADKDQAESLLKVLKESSADVSSLLTTPLMMTLLVILYKSLQTVPDTVPKFYEELFDVLFYRHDHSKPGFRRKRYTQLDDNSVKKLFSALCFFTRVQGLGVLSNEQLQECFEQASEACGIKTEFQSFKLELVKTICLLQEEGFEVSFIHKSVAQYYAAFFVSKSAEQFAESFYELAKEEKRWGLELRFLSQIDAYRFNKLYEIPVLRACASEIGISLDFETPKDAEATGDYFMRQISVIYYSGENISDTARRSGIVPYIGWALTKDMELDERGPLSISEFSYLWTSPIRTYLNKIKAPAANRKTPISIGSNHFSIPLVEYRYILKDISSEISRKTVEKMRERFLIATNVIELEGRKPAILAAFLKRRDTSFK